ncbi:hypothetical protein L3Q82_007877 [Scortum barcoo]|uniref:Uncharacterized protein n=1 Tax=Scortum barcoo TaxID=214431 RepID=A0ACB8WJA9_9TELE|nr:hypothetical protein L3Q82_007877 [Scortum barcoo]
MSCSVLQPFPNKVSRLRWKRLTQQKTRLVVRDVVCLPRGNYVAECVQGSRVLFVPDTPAEGWTGEQVLRISGHGALYILSHQDDPEADSEKSASEAPVVNRKKFCLEASTQNCLDEDTQLGAQTQAHIPSPTEEFTLDLDSILRLFRQENIDRNLETQIHVRRSDLLSSAV